jgi:hypothetical protein
VVNRLTFAPNLYELRTTAAEDALAASVALHDNSDFVFAKPSFVEYSPARFTRTDPDYRAQWRPGLGDAVLRCEAWTPFGGPAKLVGTGPRLRGRSPWRP